MEEKKALKNLKVFSKVFLDLKNKTSYSVEHLLNNDVEKTLSKYGIKIRKVFSPLLRLLYNSQSDYKLIIDSKEKLPKIDKGTIFIVNHRQSDDIVLGVNAINRSGYIVFGNPKLVFDTPNGLGLWAYGMILLDRNDRTSREATYQKMKYVIENKGNVIIYPEGYWNLADDGLKDSKHSADDHHSDSWLIQDFNIGIFKLAKDTGAQIVTTTLHYDETNKKRCYAKRDKAFLIKSDEDVFLEKNKIKENMQTNYYNLMEKYSSYKRDDLENGGKTIKQQWEELKKELISACDIPATGYKLDLKDEKLIGKSKVACPVETNQDAFRHLEIIDYNQNNCFLLSKRLKGKK